MGKYICGLGVRAILAFAFLGFLSLSHASSPETQGLTWLLSQVQADGSLASEPGSIATPLQSRVETLTTLKLLASSPSSLVSLIAAETEDNTEYLARRAIALNLASQNADALLATLSARQNPDGGFGGDSGFASNPLDTAWVLIALMQNGQRDAASALGARSYLSRAILVDGGVAGPGEMERVEASALTLLALQANQFDLTTANIVKNLAAWLLQRQGTDGGWMGNTYLTAETFAAVEPLVADAAIRAAAQNFLAGKQAPDGSWNQDPFLTAIALRALSGQPTLPPALPASLIGQVFDATSGMALSGANIALNGPATNSLSTANDGSFAFANLAAGTYGLLVSNPGYETFTGTYPINAGQTVDAGKIMLKASINTGVVRGQVTDGATGQTLAGATVSLSGAASLGAVTDATGQFNIPGVPAGAITLTASKPGYADASGTGAIVAGETLYFMPALYPSGSGSSAGGQISGQVLALGSGTPLAGVGIEVNGTIAATTGTNGRFDLSLPPASYSIRFKLAGYNDSTLSVLLTAGAKVTANVSLVPQLTASTIHGVVTDKTTGGAISGAQVQIIGGPSATTGADGSYAFPGLSGSVFDLRVTATGYASQLVQIQIAQPGDITQNFALSAQSGLALDISPLTPTPAVAGSQTEIRIAATVSNQSMAPASVTLKMQMLDAQGSIVGNAIAYDSSATNMLGQATLDAGAQLPIIFRWNTGRFAPGTYTLIAQLVEPGTINTDNPNGQILLERRGALTISADAHFSGSVVANPPVVHANTNTPVQISATLQNDGNIGLGAQEYSLQIVNVQTGVVIASQQASGNAFASGEMLTLAFTDWVPQIAADYRLRVSVAANPTQGMAETLLHVGDAATATFVVDKAVVATGTQKIRGTVHITGQDALSGTLNDPLKNMIKTAIQKGVSYNDARASSFTLTERCTACHVQTQALVGGELTRKLTTFDPVQRNALFNILTTTQQANGSLDGYGGYQQTQTMLGLWALNSAENRAEIVGTLVKAADYLLGIQETAGSWLGDRSDGWWGGRAAHTAFNVKNLIETSSVLRQTSSGSVDSYQPVNWPATNLGSVEAMAKGLNGETYLSSFVSSRDWLSRIAPDGRIETVASNICGHIYGMVPMADGSMYLACADSTSAGLYRRSPSGTLTKLNSTAGKGLAMGPDGYLYLSGANSNTIYKVSTDGLATVYLSGGLIYRPGALAFTPAGELLIANYQSQRILKYRADATIEEMLGPRSSTIQAFLVEPDGQFALATSTGFYRYGPDGRGERLTNTRSVWISLGVPVNVAQEISKLDGAIRKATDWLLVDGNVTASSNLAMAQRLIGLGSAKKYYQGQPLEPTLQAKMVQVDALLRSRQNADGGWGRNVGNISDSMVTAQVGLALDYLNPIATDPALRKAVQLLLARQKADGTWVSENGIMSTPLAATTWVIIWLPTMLDRLGGIDTDLSLTASDNVAMDNFSLAPTSIQSTNGKTSYLWKLPSVKNAGQDIAFDLTLRDMVPGEQRPVASEAKLTFNNTFTQQPVTAPIEIPKVAASSYLDLQLTADRPQYGANEPVNLAATVSNTGAAPNAGAVALAIYAADGTLVQDLGTQSFTTLAPGAQLPLSAIWNTGTYTVGAYTAVGVIFDAQNRKVGETSAVFSIVAPAGSPLVAAKITADKISYLPTDTVNLTDRISNLTQNRILDGLSAITTVYRPDGSVLWSQTAGVAQLLPAAFKDMAYSVNLALGAAGAYRATLSVRDTSGAEIAQAETTFTVQSSAATGSGLTGSISAAPKEVVTGNSAILTATVANQGNADLAALPVVLSIVDPASQSVLASWPYSIDLARQKNFSASASWATSGSGKKTYVAVLAATVGGKSLTLASDTFTVIEPPVKLDVKQQLLRQGRLLVLLTCKNAGGNDDQNCIAERTRFLDDALSALGIEHAITATLADFTQAFRSGKYNVYWLSGGALKLGNDLAQEVREAVNRGDGLLLEGVHDERNGLLDEVAGILYRGKFSTRNQAITLTGPLFTPGVNAPTLGQPLKLALNGGTQQAKFPAGLRCDDCDDKNAPVSGEAPAIASHAYGKGRGMVMAFDLIDTLKQLQPAPLVWQEIMQTSFTYLAPQPLVPGEKDILGAGAYAVARTTLTNQGQAVALEVTDLLPPGAAVVSTSPPATVNADATQAKWRLNLAVGQTADLTLALRTPQSSGAYTLTTQIDSLWNGQSKPYGSYPLVIDVASAMELAVTSQLISGLNALAFTASRDREARDQAVKALQDAINKTAQGKNESAIQNLLDAIDKLRRITGKDMSTYRLAIDRWLQELELEWLDATLRVTP